jgi:hypothetical protein
VAAGYTGWVKCIYFPGWRPVLACEKVGWGTTLLTLAEAAENLLRFLLTVPRALGKN